MSSVVTEPLLSQENNRYVVFPIRYPQLWSLYKTAVASFWTVEEVSFLDTNEWNQLSENEREFLETTLAFFAASDGLVNENLVARFYNDVTSAEARSFYTFQMAIETIHSECYSLLIDTYVKDENKKHRLFNALEENPVIRAKGEWTMRWIESNDNFATRLIAFAIVEGVFFSSAFASIYFIKEKGILHSLTFTNELISRDEALHTEFAVTLYNMLENRLEEADVHNIFEEAVQLESMFVQHSLRCNLLGINSDLMIKYVQYVADRLLVQLGYSPLYHISTCPLDFMERISISNKSNFFEVRVAEYNKSTLGKENVSEKLSFDEDF